MAATKGGLHVFDHMSTKRERERESDVIHDKLRIRNKVIRCTYPRSGELRKQKLKSHLFRTQSLKVLPLKPGVGQYVAIHASLTARDFFLANFYPSNPFTCICSKTFPEFFLCELQLTLVPVWARRIK